MHEIKNFSTKSLKRDLLEEFLNYMNEELSIDQPYSLYFVDDKENASEALGKTAMYNPSTNSVYIYVTNRHPKDIMRSIAHELVHHKQNCSGELQNMSFEKAETDANAGGFFLRKFEDGRKKMEEQKVQLNVGARKRKDIIADYEDGDLPQLKITTAKQQKAILNTNSDSKTGKCETGYEKRKIGGRNLVFQNKEICLPKELNKEFPVGNFSGVLATNKDVALMVKDVQKNGANSIFLTDLVPDSLTNAILSFEIIKKDLEVVKGLKTPGEDYIPKRSKFKKDLKNYEKEVKKFVELQKDKIGAKPPEFPKSDIQLYTKSQLEAATRLYYLNRDGVLLIPGRTIRSTDIIGKKFEDWIFGADVNNFGRVYKVNPEQLELYRRKIKPSEKKLESIMGVEAAGAQVIKWGGKDRKYDPLLKIQDGLDLVGLSVDPYGVGVAADFINGLIYFEKWVLYDKPPFVKIPLPDALKEYTSVFGAENIYLPSENWWMSMVSFAGVTVFGDTAKITRGPLVSYVRAMERSVSALKGMTGRTSSTLYLKTFQRMMDLLQTIWLPIKDVLLSLISGKKREFAESFLGLIMSRPIAKKVAKELFGDGKLPDWFKKIDDGMTEVIKSSRKFVLTVAKRKTAIKEAINTVTAEYAKEITSKLVSTLGVDEIAGVLAKKLQQDFDIGLIDQLYDAAGNLIWTKIPRDLDKIADPVLRTKLNNMNKTQLANWAKESFKDAAESVSKEIAEGIRKSPEFARKFSNQVFDLVNSSKFREELFKKYSKEILIKLEQFEAAGLPVTESIIRLEVQRVVTKAGSEDLAGLVTGSIPFIEEEFARVAAKRIGGEAAAEAGLAIRAGWYSKFMRMVKAFIAKNVFVTQGIGGILYKKLFNSMKDEFLKVFKATTYENLKFGPKIVRPLWGLAVTYFKLLLFLAAGKTNTFLHIYARYYRPICGERDFVKYFNNIVIPAIAVIWKAALTPMSATYDYLAGTPPKNPGPVFYKQTLFETFKMFITPETGEIQINFGTGTSGFVKTLECKRFSKIKKSEVGKSSDAQTRIKLKKVYFDHAKNVTDRLNALIKEDERLTKQFIENTINQATTDEVKDQNDANTSVASDAAQATAKQKSDAAERERQRNKEQKELRDRLRAARQGRKTGFKEPPKSSTPAAKPATTPTTKPATTAPAARPAPPTSPGDSQMTGESKNLSDYRKDILEERLEKLIIGFTK